MVNKRLKGALILLHAVFSTLHAHPPALPHDQKAYECNGLRIHQITTPHHVIPGQHRTTPHKDNRRFYNYKGEVPGNHLNWSQELFIYAMALIQRFFNITSRNPVFEHKEGWLTPSIPEEETDKLTITWVGHATFLIQTGGINILTDPIFGHAHPFLYTRILQPGIAIKDLPPIHLVLISHNHLDHMDESSLRYLEAHHENITFMVPYGDKQWFDARGFRRVIESEWWQFNDFQLKDGQPLRTTFLPSRHWSHRHFISKDDINTSLWGSWMIEHQGKSIYFGGDTAFSHHFKEIGQQFPAIDVALLPIGPCEYRCWMHTTHMGPEEAGQAFTDLQARHLVPMHWGTFYFGVDHFTTPIERMALWWGSRHATLQDKHLYLVKMGEQTTF